MKHVGKTCGDLWGQSTILEVVIGKTCDREGRGITITDIVVHFSFLLHHDTALPPRVKACLELDLESSRSLPQLTFECPLNLRFPLDSIS